jgi:hypothetical protein
MDEKINQAINNLQAIANLAIDDEVIAEIATATVALLGEYAAQQSFAPDGLHCVSCGNAVGVEVYCHACYAE